MINMESSPNDAMPFVRDVLAAVATHAPLPLSMRKSAAELLRDMDRRGVILIPEATWVPFHADTQRHQLFKLVEYFRQFSVDVVVRHKLLPDRPDDVVVELRGSEPDTSRAFNQLLQPSATAATPAREYQHALPTVAEVAHDVVQTAIVGLTKLGELSSDDQIDLETVLSAALNLVRRADTTDAPADQVRL